MLDISKDISIGSNDKLVGIKAESFILKICHWHILYVRSEVYGAPG